MRNTVPLLPRAKHPNKESFRGILTLIDTPSEKSPFGSLNHRILLPRAAAEEALDSLVGMPVDYKQGWEGHNDRQPIGLIEDAWIEQNEIHVSGYIFSRNFKDLLSEMRRPTRPLGMSYELADVHIENRNEEVWRLKSFVFTGAAILYCDKAAYTATSFCIAAAADTFDGRLSFIDSCDVTGSVQSERLP